MNIVIWIWSGTVRTAAVSTALSMEIIEFGAVKLDAQLNITDRFSCFVKPQVTKKISAVISDLTNITDANLWTHARTCR